MYRKLLALIAAAGALILAPLSTGAALAEKRVALVIGNGAYQNVAQLPNPIKDATAVADMFQTAGFDWVKMRQDVGNLEFKRALREFMDAAQDADIAVVYYAGHGIQVRDMNYMIPVDARLATEVDAEDEAVSLDRIVMAIEPAKRLRLVILDACRDNPFARTMKRRVAMRAVSGGLAKMEPTVGDTLIAYAAKAGSTAEDGDGANSPFAAALIKNLAVPGLDIRLAFGRVRDDVLKRTGNKQEPFVYGSLGGEGISLVPAAAQPKVEALSEVRGDYEIAERIGTKKAWEVFLASHKEGIYAGLARAQLAKLSEAEGKPAAAASPQGLALARPEPATPAKPSGPSSEERGAWDQIKDSGDRAKLRDFIAKYPASPLAETAQNRLDSLERAAEEREDKAQADREAAQRRDEEARRLRAEQAARSGAERETARVLREEDARAATSQAARKGQDEACSRDAEKLGRLRGSIRQGWAREDLKRLEQETTCASLRLDVAALLAQPTPDIAQQPTQQSSASAPELILSAHADREAAQRRDEEARRQRAEQAARNSAERETARVLREEDARAATSQAARKGQDEACTRDAEKLGRLRGFIRQGWAREDLKRLQQETTCASLRSDVVALLAQPTPDIAQQPTQQSSANTPELILSAQNELRRLGCFAGEEDGRLGDATTQAITRYLSEKGRSTKDTKVTDSLVADLKDETSRVCPLTCSRGQHPEGGLCVADSKPEKQQKPKADARHRDETARDRDDAKRKELRREREQASREESRREREQARREESRREREQAKREESRREREQAKREESRREGARKPERARPERAASRPQSTDRTQDSSELPVPHIGVGGILGVGGLLGRGFPGRSLPW